MPCQSIADLPLFAQARTAAAPPPQPACTPPAAALPPPPEFAAIWSILERHHGAAAAITAPAIAAAAGLWPHLSTADRGTRVREVLSQHQDVWPWPVCGDSTGYYLAATPDELTHACATLRSRGVACLRRFASLRRAARRVGFDYLGHGRWAPESPHPTPARTA